MSAASRLAALPPSDLHPARWISAYVYVQNSERGEKIDTDQTRWWIKPLGCYVDHTTTNGVFIGPTGCGKSTFFEGLNCWIPSQRPGSSLYATQTDATAKKWMKTRLRKTLEACRPLDHLWPRNLRTDATDELINWKNCYLSSGGAGLSNLQEQSITYGQGDEVWTWEDGRVKEFNARSHNRENRKFFLVSQAGFIAGEDEVGKTCELHQEFDKCRKWDFGWKCKCGSTQPFSFDQLKWDEVKRPNGTIDDQASADTVRRVCPTCGTEYEDTARVRRMLHDSLEENDGYILVSDDGLRGYEGFHVDRGAVWWFPWSYDVVKKLSADRLAKMGDFTGLMEWTMKDRALGWCESAATAPVPRQPSGYTREDYTDARKVDGEVERFATIDAGGDHFWMAIRAWCAGGDSKLLYFSYLGTEDECEEKRMQYGVEPRRTYLDVGFDQERMATIIVRFGWIGLKGDGTRKRGWDWEIKSGPKKGQMENRYYSKRWFAPAKGGGRAECWHIATTPLQYFLQRLIDGRGVKWEYPDNAQPSYVKHLNGERLVDGKWTRFGANHGRDCEIYQLAGGLMHKVFLPAPEDVPEESEGE